MDVLHVPLSSTQKKLLHQARRKLTTKALETLGHAVGHSQPKEVLWRLSSAVALGLVASLLSAVSFYSQEDDEEAEESRK